MIDKRVDSLAAAMRPIRDGHTIHVSGFGESGCPTELLHALIEHGARGLTIVYNNAGNGHLGLAALLEAGRVRKMICSYPRSSHSVVFDRLYRAGAIELEVVPQGTLAERIRAAGAGIGPFYCRTSVGTPLADGKECRRFGDHDYVLEHPLRADVALIKAETADRWGNLTFRKAARNFAPIMAMAADHTIAQARRLVELGAIDPEQVVTPGAFVDAVVRVANPISEYEALLAAKRP
ncbi:MAG: 3-oxoacid CoA-transferase subunit A [Alphaproteobacteria bacterium]|nr:3-oxoacid CoA-transferase subunit A [Alphaproteobacteria bacterium]